MKHGGSGDSKVGHEDLDWRIITAVADAKGVEPLDIDDRLHDIIDVDAVKQLFVGMPDKRSMTEGRVSFTLDGCEVTINEQWDIDVNSHSSVAAD
ncbi:hypothetical protein G3I44_06235 [Halogeometricum borinquense]|uniref:Halobacterial output domain-containing protein n=1 Tax=Halogeometricum borinquense TaxID=60847 RepID=A0A6C0UH72_9EURY|nr:HalOD1 output domain-containing protein [Halogeometricum borinquense]QIB73923.1 hypothetical protein G3I44_06235 [Halogeometricum borinquense]